MNKNTLEFEHKQYSYAGIIEFERYLIVKSKATNAALNNIEDFNLHILTDSILISGY